MSIRHSLIVISALVLAFASGARAQTDMSPIAAADITRLETTAGTIGRQITTLRSTDATLAAEADRTLTELNDDITYLRVKLRREGRVSRDEYNGVRDRLETLRVRVQPRVSAQPMLKDTVGGLLAVGTQFDVRLQKPLDSATATVEQRFEATTVEDYLNTANDVVIPAGSVVRGYVSSVKAAGRVERKGSLTLAFDEIRIGNRNYPLRASVTDAMQGKVGDDATRIGTGAAVGAIIGGILGGGKGALLGVLVGGGGTIAATEGTDVTLPVGTVLRIRLDERLEVAGAR